MAADIIKQELQSVGRSPASRRRTHQSGDGAEVLLYLRQIESDIKQALEAGLLRLRGNAIRFLDLTKPDWKTNVWNVETHQQSSLLLWKRTTFGLGTQPLHWCEPVPEELRRLTSRHSSLLSLTVCAGEPS